ncbi:MAG: prepilin peptidase [Planctomycetota bacterium]|jgi:prepilin signal peptidase PulO-like enzyme (type II secretory pathway)|nr:prepilin peptidase [Blastopirellula sp.]
MNSGWDDRFQRIQTAALILTGLGLLLLVVLPTLTLLFEWAGQGVPPQLARFLPMLEPVYIWLLRVFLAIWIIFFGGCIASFLNVVAWRLPRGKSILGRSHCPQCQTQLSLRENLPIYGWLACGGRCRYCRQPIPARYVLVELAFGLILLLVGLLEIGMGGWSLPRSLVRWDSFGSRSLFVLAPESIWIFASHVCLLSALYAYTLTRLESRRIPIGIFLVALVAGLGLLFLSPAVAATQWLGVAGHPIEFGKLVGGPTLWSLSLSVASLLLGYLLGWFSSQLGFFADRRGVKLLRSQEAGIALGTVGVYLGLWSVIAVGLGAVGLSLLSRTTQARGWSYSASALVATMLYLCCWRWLF